MTYTNQAPVGITQYKGRWPENVLRPLELVVNGNTQNNQVTMVINPAMGTYHVMTSWWWCGVWPIRVSSSTSSRAESLKKLRSKLGPNRPKLGPK